MERKFIKHILEQNDYILFISALVLSSIGLLSLFSTSRYGQTNFFTRQLLWLALGVAIFFIFSSIDYRFFKVHFSPVLILYLLGILGLTFVYIFGSSVRGAQSWITLGPLNIEPVEPLKIILILILSKYFLERHVEIYHIKHIIISGIYVLLPATLVIIQPDLGSFLVLMFIWMGMIIISGIRLRHFLILVLIAIILVSLSWSFFLVDYQKDRILTFINPQLDPYGAGYNSIQSLVAIGSGGMLGKGIGNGTQSQLGFLPEAHTDFIFASIVEELGLVTAIAILSLYALIFFRIMKIIQKASDNLGRLIAIGVAIMIFVQISLNISMTLGLVPITGLTLPLISYGGSSLITTFLALGILNSIHRNSTESVAIGSREEA